MRQIIAFILFCTTLSIMAAPHVIKADLVQTNKGQMVKKATPAATQFTSNVMNMQGKNLTPMKSRFTPNNLVEARKAPRYLSDDDMAGLNSVCFLYAYDITGDSPVPADPFYASKGAYWYPNTDEDLYFAGFYWSPTTGSTYYLPLDIDYTTGEVALSWGFQLDDVTLAGTGRNRVDTIIYSILVSQDYWDNNEQNDCMGTLYTDGSIIFQDNYVFYEQAVFKRYRDNILVRTDTVETLNMFVGTEILTANGVLTYNKEQDGSAQSTNVFMYQSNDTVFVGNLWGYGVPSAYMVLTEDGKAIYPCVEFDSTDSITYLSNPICDLPDNQLSGGLGMAYPVGSYTLDAEGYIDDFTWGFEANATPDQITWDYTMPSNGYHFWYGFENNVLRYTDGSKFITPDFLYFEIDGLLYRNMVGDETVTVCRVVNNNGTVIIPETVEYNGVTYIVTKIAKDAFDGCEFNLLELPVTLTSVDSRTFQSCSIESLLITGNGTWQAGEICATVGTLYISNGVVGIPGLQINANEIFSYATTPPLCNEGTFTDYTATLHVPAASFAAYFVAPYWCNFGSIIGNAIEPTGIALNEDNANVYVYDHFRLTATISPADATPHVVSWTSTDANVAIVENGLVTAIGQGECDIIASCLDKRAICHVTVGVIEVTEIVLSQEEAILELNEQISLTATVKPDNATFNTAMWSSSNINVATVDTNGEVKAVGIGECDIIAACGEKQVSCHVTVVAQKIYISLDKHTENVLPNHMITLTPTVTPVSVELKATSSDPSVAAARIINNLVQVVGITEGTVTITVGSVDGHAFADTCQITVYTEMGDVNCDGFVNISDVTILIDYLLNNDVATFKTGNADVNEDGNITIADVTALIDFLLNGNSINLRQQYQYDNPVAGMIRLRE